MVTLHNPIEYNLQYTPGDEPKHRRLPVSRCHRVLVDQQVPVPHLHGGVQAQPSHVPALII